MSEAQEVTIIVPTRGDQAQVQRCVDALAAGAARAATPVAVILVVDNSLAADALQVMSPAGFPVPVRVIREPVTGASSARNRGLGAATTDLVVFVDDDVEIIGAWLDALVAPFRSEDVVAVVGPIALECTGPRPGWLTRSLEVWYSALHHGATTRPLDASEYGWSANLAVRRAAAADIGGFDARLGPGTGAAFNDDVDFVDRLRSDGAQIVYAADAPVNHRVGPDRLRLRWLTKRGYRQGRAFAALDRIRGVAPNRRQPLRGSRALAGAVFGELPRMVRIARDPELRRGLFADQLVQRSMLIGLAVGRWSSPP